MTSAHSPRYFALIPAAGTGARMAAQFPKQYLHVAGQSILQHSVRPFLNHPQIEHVFVVVSQGDAYVGQELACDPRLTVLYCGGKERLETVTNGLLAMQNVADKNDWVLVHDAARPGINQPMISRLIEAVGTDQIGGLLALPVTDTVKSQLSHKVTTIPRANLWLAQTPQMFGYATLLSALLNAQKNRAEVTDDASAVELLGLMPKLVEGHWCNTKITRPEDLKLIELYLSTISSSA